MDSILTDFYDRCAALKAGAEARQQCRECIEESLPPYITQPDPNDLGWCAVTRSQMLVVFVHGDNAVVSSLGKLPYALVGRSTQIEVAHMARRKTIFVEEFSQRLG